MAELYALNRHAAVEEEKRKKKEREDRLKKRRSAQQNVYRSNEAQGHTQSAMEKADHLAGLTAEGVTGEILMIMICNLFQWIFQTHFLVQKREFSKAEQLGIAYKADVNGKFPDIHPLNEKGEPDFDQKPYPQNQDINDQGFRAAIRRNGFVPPPNWLEAQYSQAYQYLEQMMGASVLTPAQREILHKRVEEVKKEGPKDDLASDRAAQMAAMREAAKAQASRPK